ncbi:MULTISPECIES: HIT family protein [unclassified Ornithinimicrobium]|uniref:HIT family protein n=1 Tax=unclassified Ornithinimicrobium TaxID=2615080 RepID=UPI003854F873
MTTLFTRIIDGSIPAEVVWADDVCVAFLDIEPLTVGHALVVPRAEVAHWVDLDGDTVAHLMQVAARVGRAQLEAFGGERVGLIVQGFEVPHAHLHVFAATGPDDFDLARKRPRDKQLLARDARSLRAALGTG